MTVFAPVRVQDRLERRVAPGAPVVLGYSGGGDSHALLCAAAPWAQRTGRRLIACIIDHALRPESAAEAQLAAGRAEQAGATPLISRWTGEKPATGVQAAARTARHLALIAAAREAGARNILLGHTLDDQAETVWMRLRAGGAWPSLAGMAMSDPSPIWPQGRGLRLLRPLLDVRRQALRRWLSEAGEAWIEDPSNADQRHERIRIRLRLEESEADGFAADRLAALASTLRETLALERAMAGRVFLDAVRIEAWGGVRLDRARLAAAPRRTALRAFDAALAAASGARGAPSTTVLERLYGACMAGQPGSGAGTRLFHQGETAWLVRDPGALSGRVDHPATASAALAEGEALDWDGRFAVSARRTLRIEALGRDYTGLEDRSVLAGIPGPARAGLTAIRAADGVLLALAGVSASPLAEIEPLGTERALMRLFPEGAPAWFDREWPARPKGRAEDSLHVRL